MDARNSIKEIVRKEDLRKGIWAQKSNKSLEKQRKDAVMKILVVFSFLIIMSSLFLYLAYSIRSQTASFLGAASVFLFFSICTGVPSIQRRSKKEGERRKDEEQFLRCHAA